MPDNRVQERAAAAEPATPTTASTDSGQTRNRPRQQDSKADIDLSATVDSAQQAVDNGNRLDGLAEANNTSRKLQRIEPSIETPDHSRSDPLNSVFQSGTVQSCWQDRPQMSDFLFHPLFPAPTASPVDQFNALLAHDADSPAVSGDLKIAESDIIAAEQDKPCDNNESHTGSKVERLAEDVLEDSVLADVERDSDSYLTSPFSPSSTSSTVSSGRMSPSSSDSSSCAGDVNSFDWLDTTLLYSPCTPTPTLSGSITSAEGETESGGRAPAAGVTDDDKVPSRKRSRPLTVDTSPVPPSPRSYSPFAQPSVSDLPSPKEFSTHIAALRHCTQSPAWRQSSSPRTDYFIEAWRDPELWSRHFSLSQDHPSVRTSNGTGSASATTAAPTSPSPRSCRTLFSPLAQPAISAAVGSSSSAFSWMPTTPHKRKPLEWSCLTGRDASLSPSPHRSQTPAHSRLSLAA